MNNAIKETFDFLKTKCIDVNSQEPKKNHCIYEQTKEGYTFSILVNELKSTYEVYIAIINNNDIVTRLLYLESDIATCIDKFDQYSKMLNEKTALDFILFCKEQNK